MASFEFAVLAPERTAWSGSANQVSLRTAGGDIGFLAGHIPYIGAVEECVCEVSTEGGSTERFEVKGGFVEMDPEGTLTLLADHVERAGG